MKRILYRVSGMYDHTERVCPAFPDENFENHLKVYRFAAQFVAGATALDVGCGTGYGCGHLLEKGARAVAGIDYSEEAIQYSGRKYANPRLDFRVVDAHNLSFEDRVFDMVVSTENLEHLRDAERNVAEIECCARTASSFSEPPTRRCSHRAWRPA